MQYREQCNIYKYELCLSILVICNNYNNEILGNIFSLFGQYLDNNYDAEW
jgi:hypothetical protein